MLAADGFAAAAGFGGRTAAGLGRWLRRGLGVSRQRARLYVHSPDGAYAPKLAAAITDAIAGAGPTVDVYFGDELTVSSHASCGYDYRAARASARADGQPRAQLSRGGERTRRIAGLLDVRTGAVISEVRQATSVACLVRLLERACERAEEQRGRRGIIVVWDNWPVHFHHDVLGRLVPQATPFALPVPRSWRECRPRPATAAAAKLDVQLCPLPTYASWLNPIEKVWKRHKADHYHGHNRGEDFGGFDELVRGVMAEADAPDDGMLEYCGLLGEGNIYTEARRRLLASDG